jgi:uncharacterized PurR-regulated membrane protein YhhQ (DUF165 family)
MNDNDRRQRTEGYTFLVLFCLTIPAANWLIGHAGTVCVSNGPCLVPVAPGIMAPSGVLMIGLALVLRDLVQRRLGVEFGIGAIIVGAAISVGLAPPSLVVASAAAFLLSEFADFAVYTPLARRRLVAALRRALSGWLSTPSCSCGWRSAHWSFSSVRSSANSGWFCSQPPSSYIYAVATSASALRPRETWL